MRLSRRFGETRFPHIEGRKKKKITLHIAKIVNNVIKNFIEFIRHEGFMTHKCILPFNYELRKVCNLDTLCVV